MPSNAALADEQHPGESVTELFGRLTEMLGPDTDHDNFTFSIKRGNLRRLLTALRQPTGAGETVERDISGEIVCGFRVAAYRETHPEYGATYGYFYSDHWSTPNNKHPNVVVERLFTEDQLRAALAAAPADETVAELLQGARVFVSTLAMYDGSAPTEDHFVSLPAIVARRAKAFLARIDAALNDGSRG